jgi:hypothetical protein
MIREERGSLAIDDPAYMHSRVATRSDGYAVSCGT